jgi:hypothetical protein
MGRGLIIHHVTQHVTLVFVKHVCDTHASSSQQTELQLVHRCHKLLLDPSSISQSVILVTTLRVEFNSRLSYRLDFGCYSDPRPESIMGSFTEAELSISLQLVKVKVKVLRNRPEGPERGTGTTVLFLDIGARRGWVVSTMPRPLYPRERPGNHCTGGWVGLRSGLDVCEISRPHRDSIPGPSIP